MVSAGRPLSEAHNSRCTMRTRTAHSVLHCGLGLALALALAGCGYLGGHPATTGHSGAPFASGPADKALAGMIDAVGPAGARAPVTLKFEILSRPQVGNLDRIKFALIPEVSGINDLRIVFGARDGIEVVSGGATREFPMPAAAQPILGSITVRPLESGIFTVSAVVGVQSPSQSVAWPFSIPLIAEEGPEPSAGVSASPRAATAAARPTP